MKTIFVSVSSAIFASVISMTLVGYAQADKPAPPVAYVTSSRIFAESTQGRAEAARIQQLQQQKTEELRTKQQALETTRQQMATLTGQPRIELQQKEQQQRIELERATQQAQIDFQSLQREANTNLQRRVRAVLDDLMKTQPYQVVLNAESSLVWSKPELDLTSAVVGRMNAQ